MTGSPGRITFKEIMEVLFGYLVFAGIDKIVNVVSTAWSGDKTEKSKQTKNVLQLLGIMVALFILFRHKFFT